MRKGKLLIETPKTIKPNDIYFDIQEKITIIIHSLKEGIITGRDITTGNEIRVHSNVDNLKQLLVQDVINDDVFELNYEQQAYLYKCGLGSDFQFFDRKNEKYNIQEACVLAKNLNQVSMVRNIDLIATSYGMYVAGQKSINEPAKKFSDWHFDVSI